MADDVAIEGLLRESAPQALGALARRTGAFTDAEDAVQEALVTAAARWPVDGVPDHPVGWLVRVASRRMVDRHRSDTARRRREQLAHTVDVVGDVPLLPPRADAVERDPP